MIKKMTLTLWVLLAISGCGGGGNDSPTINDDSDINSNTNVQPTTQTTSPIVDNTVYSAPLLDTATIHGDIIVLDWSQAGKAPNGGYVVYINNTDTGNHHTNLTIKSIDGLDVTISQCFKVAAIISNGDSVEHLLSNELCSTPAPPPPVENTQTYYIQPETTLGNCDNITADFTSIDDALAVSVPGDTFRLLPGIYRTHVNFPRGGTPTHPITLTHANNACISGDGPLTAVIDCALANNQNCVSANHSNIIIDGLVVRNSDQNGIKVDGHVNGYPNEDSHGNWAGYGNTPYNVNGANNITIINNLVHHINQDGIKIGHTNNIRIENNEIHSTGRGPSTTQQGIDMVGVYNSTIRGNYVHDSIEASQQMNVGIFAKGGSENILIENNTIGHIASPYACLEIGGDTEWYNTRYTPSEISYTSPNSGNTLTDDLLLFDPNDNSNPIDSPTTYDASTMAELRHAIVRGNILIDCDPAISFRNAYKAQVYHNTTINSGWNQAWVKLWDDGNHYHTNVDTNLFNNIFYNDPGTPLAARRGAFQVKDLTSPFPSNLLGVVIKNNIFWDQHGNVRDFNFNADANSSTNNTVNPELTLSTYSYTLHSTSPAVDNGANLVAMGIVTEPFVGKQGITRVGNSTTDIGAIEYIVP